MMIGRKLVAMTGTASWSSPATLGLQSFLGLGEDLASEHPPGQHTQPSLSQVVTDADNVHTP